MTSRRWREPLAVAILFVLPFLAYAPAWSAGRLLAPGDGTFLHYPLRLASWQALRHGDLPFWNPSAFCGTPLLAAYRPGILHPLNLAFGLLFPPFVAFQLLVLTSLGLAGALLFLLMRRLGANLVGAYVAGLSFGLGPYLVAHLGDTATVVAVPSLLLVLVWLEAFLARPDVPRGVLLALGVACLALAGSPEASGAGAMVVALRVVARHLLRRQEDDSSIAVKLVPVLAGLGLAAPQVFPSLIAAGEAGRQLVGLAETDPAGPGGAAGLVLRYVSHTPAPALAVASLPLMLAHPRVRFLGAALGLCVALQWGRGPLTAASSLGLLFDMTLAMLAGLSLSTQWGLRQERRGARLRALFLVAALASAAMLPLSAAVVGPLARALSSGVGLLALALILYFELASSRLAALWLVPLTLSVALQPSGRTSWESLPTRAELRGHSVTRETIDRVAGEERDERFFTITRQWPPEGIELAFGNLGIPMELRSANGYDPMVPLRSRALIEGLNVGGVFAAEGLLRRDPEALKRLAVRWVQVPSSALETPTTGLHTAERIDTALPSGSQRFFPLAARPVSEVRVVSSLSNAGQVPQGAVVAWLRVHLASGRGFDLPLRAGIETAEWAHEREDIRPTVRHRMAEVVETFPGDGGAFEGYRYAARLPLPSRFVVSGLSVRVTGDAELHLSRVVLMDGADSWSMTPVSAFVSDPERFEPVAVLPAVWLFRLAGSVAYARVVPGVRVAPDEAGALRLWRDGGGSWSPQSEALVVDDDIEQAIAGVGQAGPAHAHRVRNGRIEIDAAGPGILVVAESWDPGWSARVDGAPRKVHRVNYAQMGVVLPAGAHKVELAFLPRGLVLGLATAALTALVMIVVLARDLRRARG